MPINFLELALVSPNGTTHTYCMCTQTWLALHHCESSAILPLHTDRHSQHAHTWPVGKTARKWQAAAWGSLRSSTEAVAPRRHPLAPILTLFDCCCICVGVCLCAGKCVAEWQYVKLSPLITTTVPVSLAPSTPVCENVCLWNRVCSRSFYASRKRKGG